jgi:5-methylcytosine-specific restriction protein A
MAVLEEERNVGGMYCSKKWRAARAQFLSEYPQCRSCGQKATLVDHIKSHRGDVHLFWDRNNWQPFCFKCHSKKTALERNEYRRQYRIDVV